MEEHTFGEEPETGAATAIRERGRGENTVAR